MPDPVDHWRPAREADLPALAAVYRAAARASGPRAYTPAQVAAWLTAADDAEGFRARVLAADTELACDAAGAPLGFCGIGAGGHVQSLYVHPEHAGRGIGSRLLARAVARADARRAGPLDAWVTPFSRAIFLRQGFRLVETVQAPFQGVMFERYRVSRP